MRASTVPAIGAAMIVLAGLSSVTAAASGRENPNGYGFYSPDSNHRTDRYDPRSWYYHQPGHYPYYGSSYWVPRAEMRYRYRYLYHGPRYRYYPAWGYPRPGDNGGRDRHRHWNW